MMRSVIYRLKSGFPKTLGLFGRNNDLGIGSWFDYNLQLIVRDELNLDQ